MLVDICGSFNFRGGDSEAIELFIYMSWMRIVSAHTAKVVIYFKCVWDTCKKSRDKGLFGRDAWFVRPK